MDSEQRFYLDQEVLSDRKNSAQKPESENVIKLLKEIEQLKFWEQIELRRFFNTSLRKNNIF